ncbi:hypothetical protein GCM10008957_22490 [Deinococcus ruber]|uniref:Uncharacterized protein n=1 Tax=Deinococcus ruber TaxID=1848197 RepID=A0A918C7R6_9DEIO|nr:hypothetical protein GCM10008957_22490 [Deinococcus ruber]
MRVAFLKIEAASGVTQQFDQRGHPFKLPEDQMHDLPLLKPRLEFGVTVDPQDTGSSALREHQKQLQKIKGGEAGSGMGHGVKANRAK